ncbi:hypothetical protein EVAR_75237_1 [Eumeta japonica]|uniref:Uncharacterized protein n=1 Tax=Eumeta variegata TaxID=151549 RepID=A0A4C1VBQ2_EUMVA|nr:hypothetical protein EVAR_75237_1 [Eumeta japonica]
MSASRPGSDEFRDSRPSTAVNNKNIDAVRRMIKTDRHVTYHKIPASLAIAIFSVPYLCPPTYDPQKAACAPTLLAMYLLVYEVSYWRKPFKYYRPTLERLISYPDNHQRQAHASLSPRPAQPRHGQAEGCQARCRRRGSERTTAADRYRVTARPQFRVKLAAGGRRAADAERHERGAGRRGDPEIVFGRSRARSGATPQSPCGRARAPASLRRAASSPHK